MKALRQKFGKSPWKQNPGHSATKPKLHFPSVSLPERCPGSSRARDASQGKLARCPCRERQDHMRKVTGLACILFHTLIIPSCFNFTKIYRAPLLCQALGSDGGMAASKANLMVPVSLYLCSGVTSPKEPPRLPTPATEEPASLPRPLPPPASVGREASLLSHASCISFLLPSPL